MKNFSIIELNNQKIRKARKTCLIVCLILGLLSSMIMLFYHNTYITLHFYIGYTLLKLTLFYFVCTIICSSAFDKI